MSEAPDPDELLALALRLALEAGRLLLEERPADLRVADTKSSPTDIVTAMDRASEQLIVDGIRTARPDDGLLGEEGTDHAGSSGVRWVLDPLDGTVNYLYDLPAWAVSIAAELDGEAMAGVVHIPARGETFTAVRGSGAHLGDRPLRLGAGAPLDRALVSTGFGYASARRAAQGRVVAELLPQVRDIRRGGSCAVDMCDVAAGRLDAHYERGVQRWDVAAAGLIAREAGARVEGMHGAPVSPEFVLVAADPLFGELHERLAALRADGPP